MEENEFPKPTGQVMQTDEARIRAHLGEMVRGTVNEELDAMLDDEVERMCRAGRYEHKEGRKALRAVSYERSLETRAGVVKLRMPRLRRQTFETAIVERYQRRESSAEETLIEMFLAVVSVRRVEDSTEALCGTRVSPVTVSYLNKKIYAKIDDWRQRKIEGDHPYVLLDGIVMKRSWAGEVRNGSLLVAFGVTFDGYRDIFGIMEGPKEDKSISSALLRGLLDRGLSGVQLIVSDACRRLVKSVAEFVRDAQSRCCVFSLVPSGDFRDTSKMLKAIHAKERHKASAEKMTAVTADLRAMELIKAAELLEEHGHETLIYFSLPDPNWIKLRTNNPLERIMCEIRRRTRMVGAFPDGKSCRNLAAARMRHIAGTQWSTRKYRNMTTPFTDQTQGAVVA